MLSDVNAGVRFGEVGEGCVRVVLQNVHHFDLLPMNWRSRHDNKKVKMSSLREDFDSRYNLQFCWSPSLINKLTLKFSLHIHFVSFLIFHIIFSIIVIWAQCFGRFFLWFRARFLFIFDLFPLLLCRRLFLLLGFLFIRLIACLFNKISSLSANLATNWVSKAPSLYSL
jgi:hypothetical protein